MLITMNKAKSAVSFALTAAIMMTSAAALPASAEETSAVKSVTAGLSAPKITKAAKTNNSVTLRWNKVKGATGYKVYKKVGSKYKTVGTLRSGSTVKFKVKGLVCAKKYNFKVRAFKKKNGKTSWSKFSPAYSATTKPDYSLYNATLDDAVARYGQDPDMLDYFFEDIDNNGVKELFAPLMYQYSLTDFEVYTIKNGKAVCIGRISTEVLSSDGKSYYANMARQGYYSVIKLKIKKGKLVCKEIDSGYTEGEYPKYGEFCKQYNVRDRSPLG